MIFEINSNKIIHILLVIFIYFNLSLYSCQKPFPVEQNRIDSLQMINKSISENLRIDLITINARKIEMQKFLEIIKTFYKDTFSYEFGYQIGRYRKIYKVYNGFLNKYDIILKDMKLSEKQLNGLKNSLVKKEITKAQFERIYNTEKAFLMENLEKSDFYGKRIFELEPEYQKSSKIVDLKIDSLIKINDELKKIKKDIESN